MVNSTEGGSGRGLLKTLTTRLHYASTLRTTYLSDVFATLASIDPDIHTRHTKPINMYLPCRYLYQQGLHIISLPACSFLEAYCIRNKTANTLDLHSYSLVNNGGISIIRKTPKNPHFLYILKTDLKAYAIQKKTFRTNFYNKSQQMHSFLNLFDKILYVFRTVHCPSSGVLNTVYTQQVFVMLVLLTVASDSQQN